MNKKQLKLNHIYHGKAEEILQTFPDNCIDTIVTSPPYWSLRDYHVEGQLGLENTLQEYLDNVLFITKELKRVLKPSGVMFWIHGNSYSGKMGKRIGWSEYPISNQLANERGIAFTFTPTYPLPQKCLTNQNLRLLLRLTDEQGWIHRNTIIWHKPNAMPSPVKDRFTNSYETIFMLTKSKKYFFDLDAIRIPHSESGLKRKKYVLNKFGGNSVNPDGKLSKGLKGGSKGTFVKTNPLGKNPTDVVKVKEVRLEWKEKVDHPDFWSISTEGLNEAHFAVFPKKLIQPMIKSSCPRYICKSCGFIRKRKWKTLSSSHTKAEQEKLRGEYAKHQLRMKKPPNKDWLTKKVSLGWSDCGCNAGWNKGIVLDPFLGSGTTALVALKLNRAFVGIELNQEYIKIAEKRIASWINQTRLEDFTKGERK